ncbi:MAG: alpha-amylase [Pseudobutyrivibrio sp.]|nr:alpha-amylase [Pseudobutyrivibrio sp.]
MRDISWVRDSQFYHIYPLGALGCPRENLGQKTAGHRILKLMDWRDHLLDLGINAVYLGPIFESGSHGYDTYDYYNIDSRLGTNEDFKRVCRHFHEKGIKIVLDGVFNHVGRGHISVKDIINNRESSSYASWISGLNFYGNNSYNDGFSYDCWANAQELVKLNHRCPDVENHILGAIDMWIKDFGIDGLRLDAADCIDRDFFRRLKTFAEEKKSTFWLMGEIIHGDYNIYVNDDMLDAVTNYECWKGIYSSHNDHNYFEINYAMKRQWGQGGLYLGKYLYNFLDNHDVNRIYNLLKEKDNIYPCYTLLYTMPGVPSIYYGSEWAIEGDKNMGQGDWALRPEINPSDMMDNNPDLIDHIKTLGQVRKESKAIRYGIYQEVQVRNESLVFAREFEDEWAVVALNSTDNDIHLDFNYKEKNYQVDLGPHGSKIIKF